MSGGVDSSVAAGLLVAAGHDVVGATLKLWGGPSDSGCCSVGDVDDARRVAQNLGVDHHVFNYSEEFEQHVVAPFVAGQLAGRSPNPCIECNRKIKFDVLFDRARRLGFDAVATGHHARVVPFAGQPALARGVDPAKDQSYVLGYLRGDQLKHLMLPIGHLLKIDVRAHAQRLGLRTWDKPDSQDVCFIPSTLGREDFFRRRAALTRADVVDRASGEVIGVSEAAELVTVGQRRGVAPGRDGTRRYVSRVDLGARRIEVGPLEEIMVSELALDESSISFARTAPEQNEIVMVQSSAHGRVQPATLRRAGRWSIQFHSPTRPVAPGQSVVFYRVDEPTIVEGAAIVAP